MIEKEVEKEQGGVTADKDGADGEERVGLVCCRCGRGSALCWGYGCSLVSEYGKLTRVVEGLAHLGTVVS